MSCFYSIGKHHHSYVYKAVRQRLLRNQWPLTWVGWVRLGRYCLIGSSRLIHNRCTLNAWNQPCNWHKTPANGSVILLQLMSALVWSWTSADVRSSCSHQMASGLSLNPGSCDRGPNVLPLRTPLSHFNGSPSSAVLLCYDSNIYCRVCVRVCIQYVLEYQILLYGPLHILTA